MYAVSVQNLRPVLAGATGGPWMRPTAEVLIRRIGRAPVRLLTLIDSHVDSHGGHTPSHLVDLMNGRHAQSGRQRTLNDPVNGFEPLSRRVEIIPSVWS